MATKGGVPGQANTGLGPGGVPISARPEITAKSPYVPGTGTGTGTGTGLPPKLRTIGGKIVNTGGKLDCDCCPGTGTSTITCTNCITGYMPSIMQVTLSNLASLSCSSCIDFNGTYNCPRNSAYVSDCFWTYDFDPEVNCGCCPQLTIIDVSVQYNLSNVILGVGLFWSWDNSSNVPSGPPYITGAFSAGKWYHTSILGSGSSPVDCMLNLTNLSPSGGYDYIETLPSIKNCDYSSFQVDLLAVA